jgi:hypothetical protein
MSKKPRVIMRIELTQLAKDQLQQLADKNGQSQYAIASRVMGWLAHQPHEIQNYVLGLYPGGVGKSCKLVLQYGDEI